MYEHKKNRWFKHFDFMVADMIVLEITYLIVCYLRMWHQMSLFTALYRNMQMYLLFFYLLQTAAIPIHKNILKRNIFQELWETLKASTVLVLSINLYLYFVQQSFYFSRGVFSIFWISSAVAMLFARTMLKAAVRRHMAKKGMVDRLLILTDCQGLPNIIHTVSEHSKNRISLRCAALIDYNEEIRDKYPNLRIIDAKTEMEEFMKRHAIDEVLIDLEDADLAERIAKELIITGVIVHLNIKRTFKELPNQMVENIYGCQVLTSCLNVVSPVQLLIKRLMDIAGSLVGLILTGIAVIIFGPIIYIQSPGPIFYSQTRMGRSGRKFKIYKFRSMYMDADKRKAELMSQNKMDGFMFKMDNDPRIIPIGHFIRKTSIDELPQFYNILKGDMSLVGTRPPTVDEWEKYSPHHRARLSAKPGLTGMWQVSGRSDITNFEEVVALDLEYIQNWSLMLDIRLLLKTVQVVVTGKGSV